MSLTIDDALIAELAGPDGDSASAFVTLVRKRLQGDGWSPGSNLFVSAVVAAVLEGLREHSAPKPLTDEAYERLAAFHESTLWAMRRRDETSLEEDARDAMRALLAEAAALTRF